MRRLWNWLRLKLGHTPTPPPRGRLSVLQASGSKPQTVARARAIAKVKMRIKRLGSDVWEEVN